MMNIKTPDSELDGLPWTQRPRDYTAADLARSRQELADAVVEENMAALRVRDKRRVNDMIEAAIAARKAAKRGNK